MDSPQPKMAFILPTASASGQISVSRRRRTYEFLQNIPPAPSTSRTASTSFSDATAPLVSHTQDVTEMREAALQAVAQRLAQRRAAIAKDAKRKAEEWNQELIALRSPPPSKLLSQVKQETITRAPSLPPPAPTKTASNSSTFKTSAPTSNAPIAAPTASIAAPSASTAPVSSLESSQAVQETPQRAKPEEQASVGRSDLLESSDVVQSAFDAPSDAKGEDQEGVERPGIFEGSDVVKSVVGAAEDAVKGLASILQESSGATEQNVDAIVESTLKEIAKKAGVPDQQLKKATEAVKKASDEVAQTSDEKMNGIDETIPAAAKDDPAGVKEGTAESVITKSALAEIATAESVTAESLTAAAQSSERVVERVEYVLKRENSELELGEGGRTDEEPERTVAESPIAEGVDKAVESSVPTEAPGFSESGKRTLGEKILDAISDGLSSEEVPAASSEVAIDKEEVMRLVESGDIKKLTVSKLRRLLSANRLKTSGRKSELIARLTSFAKSK